MDATVHNPDQYMFDFRHIITNGRKKIGLLIGAGAPVSVNVGSPDSYTPLIPNIEGLTSQVKEHLPAAKRETYELIEEEVGEANIELVLSRIRGLAEVIGTTKVHGLNAHEYKELSQSICAEIKKIVEVSLPQEGNPFSDLVSWVNGITRKEPVEIFTTNYDLLFEEAMERAKTPYFDGFAGAKNAFFDPSSISNNDLPVNWIRLWKLHGSIGWSQNDSGEVIRSFSEDGEIMVYPSHIKYDQTQAAPFTSLFDRLKSFMLEPDTLLIASGFSFADAHISAKLSECMSANSTSAIIALQYKGLSEEKHAVELALTRPNMSVYCQDGAVINGVKARWKLGEEPSKNWDRIRQEYWNEDGFYLGDFKSLCHFLAKSGGDKTYVDMSMGDSSE
ncbi:SIR2 family protein [Kordiimonas laminariae]|uniref:SIR2 family protein n=1 Tax=Kordiimonas laminariae TaxID=2917717 RepID=UPI001FF14C74|nr:SIR2 family protein [Kordiimonas laminariae]MCK0070856.1 SIR2 family protein [Kordiimonas laminariae]